MSIATDTIPLPDKKYNIIYADPPWSFSSKEIQRYGGGSGVRFGSPRKCYSVQRKDWIKQLPVSDIADRDCALTLTREEENKGSKTADSCLLAEASRLDR